MRRIVIAAVSVGCLCLAVTGAVATSEGEPPAAIMPSRAAPNAPPKSPDMGILIDKPSVVAIAWTQYSDFEPPPTASNRSILVPVKVSASKLSRTANVTPSMTARVIARRSVA